MFRLVFSIFGLLLAFVTCAGTARAAEEPAPKKLRVAVVGEAPFVVREDGELKGVSVEIFREIASSSRMETELVPMGEIPAALDAVARREVEVVVGPISITAERAERTRFTQPYFQSSLGILARVVATNRGGAPSRMSMLALMAAPKMAPELVNAASEGDLAAVKRLLKKGADASSVGEVDGMEHTALQAAVQSESLETVTALLDAGAAVDGVTPDDIWPPLQHAA